MTFFDVIVLEQIEIMNLSKFLSFHKAVMQNMRWIYVVVASPCTRHGKEVVVQLPVRREPKQEVVVRNFVVAKIRILGYNKMSKVNSTSPCLNIRHHIISYNIISY